MRPGISYDLWHIRVKTSGKMFISYGELLHLGGKGDHQVLEQREPGQPVYLMKENAYK